MAWNVFFLRILKIREGSFGGQEIGFSERIIVDAPLYIDKPFDYRYISIASKYNLLFIFISTNLFTNLLIYYISNNFPLKLSHSIVVKITHTYNSY